jgi:hypothetical protein
VIDGNEFSRGHVGERNRIQGPAGSRGGDDYFLLWKGLNLERNRDTDAPSALHVDRASHTRVADERHDEFVPPWSHVVKFKSTVPVGGGTVARAAVRLKHHSRTCKRQTLLVRDTSGYLAFLSRDGGRKKYSDGDCDCGCKNKSKKKRHHNGVTSSLFHKKARHLWDAGRKILRDDAVVVREHEARDKATYCFPTPV